MQLDGELVWLRIRGDFTVLDCQAVFATVEQVLAQHGRFFLLGDLSQTEVMAAPTRRWIADWSRVHGQPAGAAFYGAGLLVRTFAMMLHRATNLLSRNTAPLFFSRTEQEALDWLAPLRKSSTRPVPPA
jgi:uncharacterized heparinase superfamily protein